ncbi:MAG TPA: Rrf2 family transcriptional regulator [bacterium]|nr:Rrf2 family transcriptional regulator [bacterium]HPS30649.1 Rrf2 family transcriptional regulator [bacterium]
MKLTTKSEYSILSLIYIARNQGENEFIKVEDICKQYDLSRKYLEQLLLILKNSGFIKTRRGASGGCRLSKMPKDISLAEIIRLMDGALAPTESVSVYFYSNTPIEKEKKVLNVMKKIRDYISDTLEKTTLSDLI